MTSRFESARPENRSPTSPAPILCTGPIDDNRGRGVAGRGRRPSSEWYRSAVGSQEFGSWYRHPHEVEAATRYVQSEISRTWKVSGQTVDAGKLAESRSQGWKGFQMTIRDGAEPAPMEFESCNSIHCRVQSRERSWTTILTDRPINDLRKSRPDRYARLAVIAGLVVDIGGTWVSGLFAGIAMHGSFRAGHSAEQNQGHLPEFRSLVDLRPAHHDTGHASSFAGGSLRRDRESS